MMVSGGITKDVLSKGKVNPCGIYSLRVKAKSVLFAQYGKWIHSRCPGVKGATVRLELHTYCKTIAMQYLYNTCNSAWK